MVLEFINLYGSQIIGSLLICLFGVFGMAAKKLAVRYLDNPVKQQLAKLTVQFVEQAYRELHGKDKLSAALSTLSGLLAERGIRATQNEMTVLIEAAVAELNDVFRKAM